MSAEFLDKSICICCQNRLSDTWRIGRVEGTWNDGYVLCPEGVHMCHYYLEHTISIRKKDLIERV